MGKKKRNPKKTSKVSNNYSATGELERKNKFCPKCGPGVMMANHKDRKNCGKCGYMEKN